MKRHKSAVFRGGQRIGREALVGETTRLAAPPIYQFNYVWRIMRPLTVKRKLEIGGRILFVIKGKPIEESPNQRRP